MLRPPKKGLATALGVLIWYTKIRWPTNRDEGKERKEKEEGKGDITHYGL
jgi:hypothetical protein